MILTTYHGFSIIYPDKNTGDIYEIYKNQHHRYDIGDSVQRPKQSNIPLAL